MKNLEVAFTLLDELKKQIEGTNADIRLLGPALLKDVFPDIPDVYQHYNLIMWSTSYHMGGSAQDRAKIASDSCDLAWGTINMQEKKKEEHEVVH